jgi:hypothetical protein
MNGLQEMDATMRRVVAVLDAFGIKFHFTGGLVASIYGEPRYTQDVDIVISFPHPEGNIVTKLIDAFSGEFLFEPEFLIRAIEHNDMFQMLDRETSMKVDFHVGEAIEGELSRSESRELLPGLTVPVVAKSDAILSKLLWIKKGSEKSRRDVIMMIRGSDPIDWPDLEQRAAQLGIADLLMELRQQAAIIS